LQAPLQYFEYGKADAKTFVQFGAWQVWMYLVSRPAALEHAIEQNLLMASDGRNGFWQCWHALSSLVLKD
jgi:hypothetical protein